MKIVVDGMGGDNAPHSTVEGVVSAINEFGVDIIITGDKALLSEAFNKYSFDKSKLEIINTTEVIENEDKPVKAIRSKKDSSMVVGINLVKQAKADAIVSAGNTGALLAGGLFILGRIEGVDRPALCSYMPTKNGMSILLDAGANSDCKPRNLLEFGIMGSIYANKVLEIDNPKVAIVNVGIEEGKGNELSKKSYELLKNSNVNFIGNVEARDIPFGYTDVIVCDGFTGNVVLKLTEGVAMSIFSMLKETFNMNLKTKLGAALVKDHLRKMKDMLDYTEYGGAPLLGVNGPVIKAHGSSNGKAIKNAIKQAIRFINGNVLDEIKLTINSMEDDIIENS
ncbi:phosphate:acyl-[acyl carrier protein] acyltransferase [Alkalithermobacter thermoalcaliphilus JW-YL-7 = DSM 7308]|uniref:Phosphate acyltransferase n=1 Tax=Alkalithermobacter thermoalcaliphilus JW-YL-7 = DSM 7308 TaxID=1121328 RepID=A0A150FPT9_CLOPD|nr:Phosphate acyltransferase [[Clostridium] paradoxum JW-YL-7 = DSM 7308]SHK95452.1 phosphate:acyl-[acyl carrier protein] acyltransferase [[Clostridium] paradoxum JW-YL-7 = DSM 7308]